MQCLRFVRILLLLMLTNMFTNFVAAEEGYDVLGVRPGMEVADALSKLKHEFVDKKHTISYLDSRLFLTPVLAQGYPQLCFPIIGGLQDAAILTADDQTIGLFFDPNERQKKVHTIIRILDLKIAGVSSKNVLTALRNKYGKSSQSPSSTHAWGRCLPDTNLYTEKREGRSLSLSPDELILLRKLNSCSSAMSRGDGNRFYGFYLRHSEVKSSVLDGVNNAIIYKKGEEIDPSNGLLRKEALKMYFPERGFFVSKKCGIVAYAHFFESSYPDSSQKVMIFVSNSDDLILNVRKGLRSAVIENKKNSGRGDVKF